MLILLFWKLKILHQNNLHQRFLKLYLRNQLTTKTWMSKGIYKSRAKDYTNPFRKMVYETKEEMNAVIGRWKTTSLYRISLLKWIIIKN